MEKQYEGVEQRFTRCYQKYGERSVLVLMGFYRGQYHKFLLSTFFFVVKHSPALFSSLLIANVINGVVEGGEAGRRAIFLNTGIWLLLLCLHLPANWLHNRYKSRVIRNTEAGLRAALVVKLQELSIPFHSGTQSGRLQSKIMRDVEAVETLSSQLFVNLMNIVMNLVITLTITAAKNRLILLFFVLVAPVAAGAVVLFRSRIHRENRAFRQEMEETSAKVMEMVEMVPVTRAHALEDKEVRRLTRQLEETAERGYRLDMIQAHFGAVSWCIFQVFQVLCLGVSGFMAFFGMIQVGDVTFYQSSFTTVVNQFTALINLLPVLTKGLESVTSIGEILSSNEVERYEGKAEMEDLQGEYDFRHVRFSYAPEAEPVLDTRIEEHGANLSGGQRQRISIARAMIRKPKVIILDEATSALDTISEKEIQDALERLTEGKTTFIVAHRLSTVRGADRIVVMDKGRIREEGSYQELMDLKGQFYEMERLQMAIR